jgi:hypothetical protein
MKYLDAPAQGPAQRQRESKLDPFKATIAEWLEKGPTVTAAVMEQRLRPIGYSGGHSLLSEHVHTVRPQLKPSRAFRRMSVTVRMIKRRVLGVHFCRTRER